jgi:hypothetical protein
MNSGQARTLGKNFRCAPLNAIETNAPLQCPAKTLKMRIRAPLLSLRKKGWVCTRFWVAQRFTAAITGPFSAPALAAEVTLLREEDFFRKLVSGAANPPKIGHPSGGCD